MQLFLQSATRKRAREEIGCLVSSRKFLRTSRLLCFRFQLRESHETLESLRGVIEFGERSSVGMWLRFG